jgi:hypothetical protein
VPLGKKPGEPADGDASSVEVISSYSIEGRQLEDQQLVLEFDPKKIIKNYPEGGEKKTKKRQKIRISINEEIARILGIYPLCK